MTLPARDLIGQRFGRLAVWCRAEKKPNDGHAVWLCRCDCGNLTEVRSSNLLKGTSTSCGCLHNEMLARRVLKHGDTINGMPVRLYKIWADMKNRCLNPTVHAYKTYGGRGIVVCKEWLNDYTVFKQWALANEYTDDLTIDRIDNDGDYEPPNCQWITKSENSKKGNGKIMEENI